MKEDQERSTYIQALQNTSIFISVDGKTTAEPRNNAESEPYGRSEPSESLLFLPQLVGAFVR